MTWQALGLVRIGFRLPLLAIVVDSVVSLDGHLTVCVCVRVFLVQSRQAHQGSNTCPFLPPVRASASLSSFRKHRRGVCMFARLCVSFVGVVCRCAKVFLV